MRQKLLDQYNLSLHAMEHVFWLDRSFVTAGDVSTSATGLSVFFIDDVRCDGINRVDHSFDTIHSHRAHPIGYSQQCAAGAELCAKNKNCQRSHGCVFRLV